MCSTCCDQEVAYSHSRRARSYPLLQACVSTRWQLLTCLSRGCLLRSPAASLLLCLTPFKRYATNSYPSLYVLRSYLDGFSCIVSVVNVKPSKTHEHAASTQPRTASNTTEHLITASGRPSIWVPVHCSGRQQHPAGRDADGTGLVARGALALSISCGILPCYCGHAWARQPHDGDTEYTRWTRRMCTVRRLCW